MTEESDLSTMLRLAKAIVAGQNPRLPVETSLTALAKTVIFLMEERSAPKVPE